MLCTQVIVNASFGQAERITGSSNALIVVLILIFVIGIPFTLWWWRMADKWADGDQKRFKSKKPAAPVERVVIRETPPGETGRDE